MATVLNSGITKGDDPIGWNCFATYVWSQSPTGPTGREGGIPLCGSSTVFGLVSASCDCDDCNVLCQTSVLRMWEINRVHGSLVFVYSPNASTLLEQSQGAWALILRQDESDMHSEPKADRDIEGSFAWIRLLACNRCSFHHWSDKAAHIGCAGPKGSLFSPHNFNPSSFLIFEAWFQSNGKTTAAPEEKAVPKILNILKEWDRSIPDHSWVMNRSSFALQIVAGLIGWGACRPSEPRIYQLFLQEMFLNASGWSMCIFDSENQMNIAKERYNV